MKNFWKSLRNLYSDNSNLNHDISKEVSAIALSSASSVDLETTNYFLKNQLIRHEPSNKHIPFVLLEVSKQESESPSQYASNCKEE